MTQDIKHKILEAALVHVPFDGWSQEALNAALSDLGLSDRDGRAAFPRGPVDMAIAFHKSGDEAMIKALSEADLGSLKFREKIATAVRLRLDAVAPHKEAVRRGTTLFALPTHAGDGARLIWGTCDLIWRHLGDRSTDYNWYTKRATLSAVYTSTVLYWLGDNSKDHSPTWEFLDRRIENVMQFEQLKAKAKDNPVVSKLMAGPNWLLSRLHAPSDTHKQDLPGFVQTPETTQE